jgi:hypothetical protein
VGLHFVDRTACLMLTNNENPHDASGEEIVTVSAVASSAIFFKLKPQTLAAAHFVVDDGWTVLAL